MTQVNGRRHAENSPKSVGIIGVPMDLGAGRRGVDMGPYAIRYAGLERGLLDLGLEIADHHNIQVPGPEGVEIGDPRAKYLSLIEDACGELIEDACGELRLCVAEIARSGAFPLVLGGDHSIAMGSVAGLLDAWGAVGVLWIDAHGDINTPDTSPSGNVHGMPVAALLGQAGLGARLGWTERLIDPRRMVLFGTRTLDPGERRRIRDLGVRMFTMSEIDQRGLKPCLDEAISLLAGAGGIHISFDIDAVDPLEAPGVGTPWPGGLTYREAHLAMEILADTGHVASMEVVEVNPIADHENRTGKLAAELILSALGRRIA